ncbi:MULTISPECIES: DUF4163 domain-containing protein [Clostridium]|uniref:Deacetylase PdaC domain-containing protein n=1 Tax=Clostridium cibarium TaxID=2762247 RepID=A0ABR8PTG4_9CLOT|nr:MULTISPECIES: DUF4163 domain-containing protein [Clostridium]MBD7911465.1 hypothetical protein [Clostridium cibarium]
MNRKKLTAILILIFTGIFMIGCANKQISNDTDSKEGIKTEVQQPVDTNTTKETTSKNTSEKKYKITKEVYKIKNVIINYPQISGLSDINKQSTINKLIKDGAEAYISNGVEDNLNLEINYKITLSNENVLSIQYSGVANLEQAAHPTNVFYTTNIDMNNGKIIKLTDLLKVNENLANSFKKGKLVCYTTFDNEKDTVEYQSNIKELVNNMDNNELISQFEKADSKEKMISEYVAFCYLTEDSIGISIGVGHSAGDHVEYEMKYADLRNNKNTNNKIW